MHLLYQKTAKNAVAIRFVNYSVDIIYQWQLAPKGGTVHATTNLHIACRTNNRWNSS